MVHQLSNYNFSSKQVKIMFDNFSVICLSKILLHNFPAKHIDMKHQFIRHHELNGDIEISFISTDFQLASIFTKPL